MASRALKSILCGCIVLLIGAIDGARFSAMARSTTTSDADKSIALLQQHLCRDECSKKVSLTHKLQLDEINKLFSFVFGRKRYKLNWHTNYRQPPYNFMAPLKTLKTMSMNHKMFAILREFFRRFCFSTCIDFLFGPYIFTHDHPVGYNFLGFMLLLVARLY